jgi:hypothetical protein
MFDGTRIMAKTMAENEAMLALLGEIKIDQDPVLVIEKIASYGMAVGASIFETCWWSGRFAQAYPGKFERLTRGEVKMHLCGSMRAKDSNVRQSLIDRFGEPGKRSSPGRTYGVRADEWSAFAIAVTWYDLNQPKAIPAIALDK